MNYAFYISFVLLGLTSSCARTPVMLPSASVEACRMDEETKRVFFETNPHNSSFSIALEPTEKETWRAAFSFHGFPQQQKYLLFCLNTADTHQPLAMYSITLAADKILFCDGALEIQSDTISLPIKALPGFQSIWYLWSEDDTIRLSQTITPRPLKMSGIDGATLSILRKEAGGNIAEIVATGLKENEQVCFILQSLDAESLYPIKAPSNGIIRLPFQPSFAGRHKNILAGTTSLLLVRENETLALTFDWDLSTTTTAAARQ